MSANADSSWRCSAWTGSSSGRSARRHASRVGRAAPRSRRVSTWIGAWPPSTGSSPKTRTDRCGRRQRRTGAAVRCRSAPAQGRSMKTSSPMPASGPSEGCSRSCPLPDGPLASPVEPRSPVLGRCSPGRRLAAPVDIPHAPALRRDHHARGREALLSEVSKILGHRGSRVTDRIYLEGGEPAAA